MQQKEVLIIVLVIVGGIFLLKSGTPASQTVSGNAIRMTCEDPCYDKVTERISLVGSILVQSCSQSFCSTCKYKTFSGEETTLNCIPHYQYIDNRWLTPMGYTDSCWWCRYQE